MGSGRRQPYTRDGMSAGIEVNQPAVDARNLAARPGSSLMRKSWSDAPLVETPGPSERSIFPSRNLQGENGNRGHPIEDMNRLRQHSTRRENGFQQYPPREGSARYNSTGGETASQAYQTRFPKNQANFQPSRDEGRSQRPGRSRTGRSRASRDSDDSEPRRRKRGAEGGFDRGNRNGPKKETWTAEELQYLKEKVERESPTSSDFEPLEMNKETFTGIAPATASDEWGMSEMLGERLLLARKHLDQEFIQWDSKEQKADVMAVVEKLKAVRRGGNTDRDVETAKRASPVAGSGDQQAQALMQKLFAGEYAKFKRPGENDVLGHVERHVHRNDSFYPDDEKSLLEKVRSILPGEQASRVGRVGKKEVKA